MPNPQQVVTRRLDVSCSVMQNIAAAEFKQPELKGSHCLSATDVSLGGTRVPIFVTWTAGRTRLLS